jgi:hypothetical protein
MSGFGIYRNCIFFQNTLKTGLTGERYELDLPRGGIVEGCFILGPVIDPLKIIEKGRNTIDAPDPQFTPAFVPQNERYKNVGYRPPIAPVR